MVAKKNTSLRDRLRPALAQSGKLTCRAEIAVPSEDLEELPPVVADRRRPLRRKSFLGALVVSRDRSRVWACTVRDLTAGARIRMASEKVLPGHSYQIIPGKEIAHQADVVRNRREEYGREFLRTLQRANFNTREPHFLNRNLVKGLLCICRVRVRAGQSMQSWLARPTKPRGSKADVRGVVQALTPKIGTD
jgi:hypothetical protein